MTFKEYIDFWIISWGYMKGSRKIFWLGLFSATIEYRKIMIEHKKKEAADDTV